MIKLIKNTFFEEEKTKKELADFIINSKFLSMGEECKKFEKRFSEKQNRKYSVLVSNGSSANLLLIQSLLNLNLLKKGDKIGVSALTWATNVMPLIQLGLVPILIDCEIENLNVSKKTFQDRLAEHNDIKAMFITNALGFCADIKSIRDACKDNKILLLEDNCESLGSKVDEILLGNFGFASTFSFFVGHHMSTIEGGMICTDDEQLYNMLCMVRAHGWDRNLNDDDKKSLREKFNIDSFFAKYTFYHPSYNARPTEITGFLGNNQIEFLDTIISNRIKNFNRFCDAAKTNNDIVRLNLSHMSRISNFAFPLIFKDKETCEKYKKRFSSHAEIRPIIAGNIQKHPFFRNHVNLSFNCPNADFIHENGFYFGNNPEMNEEELNLLCNLIKHG